MIESPILQAVLSERTRETRRRDIVRFLVARFGNSAKGLTAVLEMIEDDARLDELVTLAATCPDLDAFRAVLSG